MDLKTQMKQALQKIDIYYNNCLISHEHLVRKYEDFLCSSFSEKEHNEAIVLHTGSICFEVASLVFAAISNLILNDNSVDDILDSLKDGDRVIYKKKRYIYRGIKEKECDCSIGKKVHLVQEANKTEAEVDVYIQYKDGYKIRPYHGESKTTGGRGVRKSNEERTFFVSSLLGCDLSDVPSVVDSSTVIVISKTKADDILNNTQIKCEEQKINLLDLVTASYYTENNKFPYAGNTEKAEPIIKITSKLDISRKLVKKESSNRVQGLMVFEQESETELTELMERRSLRYVYALYSISSESGSQLVNLYPDAAIFECTKKFLLENVKPIAQSNFYTKKLANQSDIIINKKINRHILNIGFSWEYLKKIKKQIKSVKDTNVASNNKKDSFVIQAYALLNLLLTASFNTIDLQNTIEELKLGVIPPKERIRDLYSYAESFTEEIKGTALDIVESLDLLYDTVFENNLKEKSLKEILSDHINEQIIIVVPKTYYVSVLQRIFRDYFNLAIVNVNNFKNEELYDRVVVVGDIKGKKFNLLRCNSAREIDVILYECEHTFWGLKYGKEISNDSEYDIQKKIIGVDELNLLKQQQFQDVHLNEYENISEELESFCEKLNIITIKNMVNQKSNSGVTQIDVIKVGKFVNGENILFSQYYKAIVFDETNKNVIKKDVADLTQGDIIIFKKNDDSMKDLIDNILEGVLEQGLLDDKINIAYIKANRWKKLLQNYKEKNNLTYTELSEKFAKVGLKRDYATIRSWIDPFSHIVGPQKEKDFECIAKITQDKDMLNDPKGYYESCRTVRVERRKILKFIKKAIINELSGSEVEDNELLKKISENIDDISERLQIESIMDLEEDCRAPIGMVNKPITI